MSRLLLTKVDSMHLLGGNKMTELGIGNNTVMMEYIITTADGEHIRMLLDADEYSSVRKVLNVLSESNKFENICDYGSKDIEVVGA